MNNDEQNTRILSVRLDEEVWRFAKMESMETGKSIARQINDLLYAAKRKKEKIKIPKKVAPY